MSAMIQRALASLLLALPVTASAQQLPTFHDSVRVVDALPLLQPVPAGSSVRVRFPVGELVVTSADVLEARAELRVECRELSEKLCAKYRSRLRLEGEEIDGVVEVRLVGLPRWKLRKLRLDGEITVPSWAPLELQVGVGDVDVDVGEEDVSIALGIGDLTVRAPMASVASVRAATGIGDASISGAVTRSGKRRRLLGARLAWEGADVGSHIEVGLRIGDAKVVLE